MTLIILIASDGPVVANLIPNIFILRSLNLTSVYLLLQGSKDISSQLRKILHLIIFLANNFFKKGYTESSLGHV